MIALLSILASAILSYGTVVPVSTTSLAETYTPWIEKVRPETKTVWITAYSSTPEETDDTPFITATGNTVRDGIVAANFLPFGTEIKIPSLFGNKVFVVDDRMHPRKTNVVDVWMPSKEEAIQFGAHRTEIEILPEADEEPLFFASSFR